MSEVPQKLSALHNELLSLEAETFEIHDPVEIDEQGMMGSTTSTTSSSTSCSGTSCTGTSTSCNSTSCT